MSRQKIGENKMSTRSSCAITLLVASSAYAGKFGTSGFSVDVGSPSLFQNAVRQASSPL